MAAGLTPKQEAFCTYYLQSGNATDAYRKAGYGPNMAEKTISEAASRLLKNSKVVARIEALRVPVAEKAQLTLETHLADLQRLRNMAAKKDQFSAAISAEIARGKAAGLYSDKSQQKSGADGAADLLNEIADRLPD